MMDRFFASNGARGLVGAGRFSFGNVLFLGGWTLGVPAKPFTRRTQKPRPLTQICADSNAFTHLRLPLSIFGLVNGYVPACRYNGRAGSISRRRNGPGERRKAEGGGKVRPSLQLKTFGGRGRGTPREGTADERRRTQMVRHVSIRVHQRSSTASPSIMWLVAGAAIPGLCGRLRERNAVGVLGILGVRDPG